MTSRSKQLGARPVGPQSCRGGCRATGHGLRFGGSKYRCLRIVHHPHDEKAGFKPHVAAATEATASTGGQLMPPITGSAVFIMAQNISDVTYNDVIVIAVIPVLLYFLRAFLSVHFDAKKNLLQGLPVEELPTWRSIYTRIDLLLPLVVIVTTLLVGFTPMRAAIWGILSAFLLSFVRASHSTGFSSNCRNARGCRTHGTTGYCRLCHRRHCGGYGHFYRPRRRTWYRSYCLSRRELLGWAAIGDDRLHHYWYGAADHRKL